ncbi:hypothetical protein CP880_01135 [Cutibacterium namnetense]|uniref:Uncharacterized protein n=1 Tax=Cutibacterium namnetense TaxID=1574624 RepID=A0ABX9IC34_9ACTN|nr:hypothetical protein CP880_01135 [Cutibacterium namnetense]
MARALGNVCGCRAFLVQLHVEASRTLVVLAVLIVLVMLVMPFINAKRDNRLIEFQALGLVGSHTSCAAWVLVMLAAQLAPLMRVAEWSRSGVIIVVIVTVVAAFICGVVVFVSHRRKMHTDSGMGLQMLKGVVAVGNVPSAKEHCGTTTRQLVGISSEIRMAVSGVR